MDKIDPGQAEQHELTPAEIIAGSQEHRLPTAIERSLLWKADLVIIPIFSMMFLVTYLV